MGRSTIWPSGSVNFADTVWQANAKSQNYSEDMALILPTRVDKQYRSGLFFESIGYHVVDGVSIKRGMVSGSLQSARPWEGKKPHAKPQSRKAKRFIILAPLTNVCMKIAI